MAVSPLYSISIAALTVRGGEPPQKCLKWQISFQPDEISLLFNRNGLFWALYSQDTVSRCHEKRCGIVFKCLATCAVHLNVFSSLPSVALLHEEANPLSSCLTRVLILKE